MEVGSSFYGGGIGVAEWLVHIVLSALAGNSHSVLAAPVLSSCSLSLSDKRLPPNVKNGLTYKKVKGSRTNIVKRAVRLQGGAAFLTVHGRKYLAAL